MKTFVTALCTAALMMILSACGQSSGLADTPANVDISLRVEPETLAVGESTLIVTLTDDGGGPIDGAALHVVGNMDHEGMEPVERDVETGAGGEYRVPFAWTMGGGWLVTVTARLPGRAGEVEETFELFVEAISSESIINRRSAAELDGDNIAITYQPDNDPALGGDATVTITVMDAGGQPVLDAAVRIHADMAHHGMLPVTGEGSHTEAGHYVVPVRWTMAGDWQVTVNVTLADGRVVEQTFDQQVVIE